jgi:signal transduction histidine kinase
MLRAELEALQDGVRPLDRAAVDSLHGDSLRLGRLVDDLYELSMSDLGALTYRKVETDPAEVLAADVEAFKTKFSARRAPPIPALPQPLAQQPAVHGYGGWVDGDPQRVRQRAGLRLSGHRPRCTPRRPTPPV